MMDKNMKFMMLSSFIYFICMGLILGSLFLDNNSTQKLLIIVAFFIMIVQKIVEIIVVKKTRKISIPILGLLIAGVVYFLIK